MSSMPRIASRRQINGESVLVERGLSQADASQLKSLLSRHVELTSSAQGRAILDNWAGAVNQFWKVIPRATLLLQAVSPDEVEAKGAAD